MQEIFTGSTLTATQIKKYAHYSTTSLKKKAGDVFRAWIRNRDKGNRCISCGAWEPSDAGHFYPAGTVPALEFDEDNVHLQCRKCNFYESANLHHYRPNLIKKIGLERVERLDYIEAYWKGRPYKQDRFRYIEIIIYYSKSGQKQHILK